LLLAINRTNSHYKGKMVEKNRWFFPVETDNEIFIF
jgi:hypothetical protein